MARPRRVYRERERRQIPSDGALERSTARSHQNSNKFVDFGFDEFDAMDILTEVEKKLGIEVDKFIAYEAEDANEGTFMIHTVGDLVSFVQKKVDEPTSGDAA